MDTAVLTRRLVPALFVALLLVAAPASAAPPDVVATGLNDPRGIDAGGGSHGDRLLVAQAGGNEISEILVRKNAAAVVQPFATVPPSPADVVQYGFDKAFATISGPPEQGGFPGAFARVPRNGNASVIADIADYQKGDPDPVDQEGAPDESNPFGIALIKNGFLVVDSANNDLLRIDKDGDIETVARFPTRQALTPPGLPEGPPAGTPIDAEAVPTAVAVGPDGAWYVSELRGFPFAKGASRIWRIKPGTEDATCNPNAKRGPCTVFADGFTSVIDIAWKGDTLLVLEIVKEGLLTAESGGPPIGALWAYDHGSKTEIEPGSLLAPGGVAVADHKRIYVTTGTVFGPGGGSVVRFKDAVDHDGHGHRHKGHGHGHGDHRHHGHHRRHRGDHKNGSKHRKHAHKSKKRHRRSHDQARSS
jgi:hypothetical protein